ncbi:hypothetical protein N8586_05995, partial [Verrucomicrobiales bacterium]|nr:hypothetical protein [Verrucomicrobiales bacterium]
VTNKLIMASSASVCHGVNDPVYIRPLALLGLTALLTISLVSAQNADVSEVCSRIAREAASYACKTNAAGDHTTIEITRSGIIEWQDFRVPEKHTLEFVFQEPSQWVVNQVVSSARSFVLGKVLANGKIALINPRAPIEVRSEIRAYEVLLATANVAPETVFGGDQTIEFSRVESFANKVVINRDGAIISDRGDLTIIAGGTLGNDGRLEAAHSLRLTTFGDNTFSPSGQDAFKSSGDRGYSFVHRGLLQAGTRDRDGIIEIDVVAMTLNGSVIGPTKGTILVQADSIRNEPGAIYRGPPVSRVFINARNVQGALGFQQDDGANPSRLPSLAVLSRGNGTIRRMQPMNPARSVSARPIAKATNKDRRKLIARSTRRFSQVYRQSSQRSPKPKRR